MPDYRLRAGSTVLDLTTWYHVVATYDGTQTDAGMKLYLQGVDDTAGMGSSGGFPTAFTNDAFYLGGFPAAPLGSDMFFEGRLCEVGFWSRELTLSEITDLYNGGSGLTY